MENIFEKASESKLRFETTRGSLATEDLYDLNLAYLDTLAKGINKKLKEESEESFIEIKSKKSTTTELELKLEILKAVIKHRLASEEARKLRAQRREELEFLKGLVKDKTAESLKAMPLEEIQKKIAELQEA